MNRNLNSLIIQDWLQEFPDLQKYGKNKLFKVLGPLIVGIELIKLPFSDEYRPHFVCYMLWEENIKSCLIGPILLSEI